MVGAAVAAAATGVIREAAGDYATAWFLAGGLALLASVACLALPRTHEPTIAGRQPVAS